MKKEELIKELEKLPENTEVYLVRNSNEHIESADPLKYIDKETICLLSNVKRGLRHWGRKMYGSSFKRNHKIEKEKEVYVLKGEGWKYD